MTGHATTSSIPAWRHAEFAAYIRKCFLRHKEPIRSKVDVSVTFGPDGMIVGDPEIKDPIDSDAFRRDTRTALKKIRQCQPYIVDPFARTRTQLTQEFRFGRKAPEEGRSTQQFVHISKNAGPHHGPGQPFNFGSTINLTEHIPEIRSWLTQRYSGIFAQCC